MTPLLPAVLLCAYVPWLTGGFSLGKFLAVAAGGVWLSLGNSYRRRWDWVLLCYLAWLSICAVLSSDPWVSLIGLQGTYNAGLMSALVLIPYWACVDSRDREKIVRGLLIGTCVLALVGIGQRFGWFLMHSPDGRVLDLPTGHRAYSLMGSPIYLGAAAALCAPFLRGWWQAFLMGGLLWSTGSRSSWLAVASGLAYLHWPALSARYRIWAIVLAGVGMCGAMTYRPPSDLGRIAVYHSALEGFAARPWFGWGPGNFITVAEKWRSPLWDEVYGSTTQDHAHNLFLEAASTIGLPGLIITISIILLMWECAKDRPARSALLSVFVVGMMQPLPLVVKALAVSLAASGGEKAEPLAHPAAMLSIGAACKIFIAAMFLILLDRLMTYYGNAPWSHSSIWAAYISGVIKEIQTPVPFRL